MLKRSKRSSSAATQTRTAAAVTDGQAMKSPSVMVEGSDWFHHPETGELVEFDGLLNDEPVNGVVGVFCALGEKVEEIEASSIVLMLANEQVPVFPQPLPPAEQFAKSGSPIS